MRLNSSLFFLLVLSTSHGIASDWNEIGEAGGFPGQAPQITTADDTLESISGMLTMGSDNRDSYCINVTDPGAFLATTDPAVNAAAAAGFNTRLFLFNRAGDAVLANDDTSLAGSPFLSTLAGTATDGSGFVLVAGKYILTIAGSADEPEDDANIDLFDIGSDVDFVHAANPAAGLFAAWTDSPTDVGSYTIALEGAVHCEASNEIVFANSGISGGDKNTFCSVKPGGTTCTDVDSTSLASYGVDVGDIDNDGTLDAVFTNGSSGSGQSACLYDAGFSCTSFDEGVAGFVGDVKLGLIDADNNLDAIFTVSGQQNSSCLGDGAGGFSSCSRFGEARSTERVALGRFDNNKTLDAVFANAGQMNEVCLNDGDGAFICSDVSPTETSSRSVAAGQINGDIYDDALFVGFGVAAELCLGSATGSFSCSDVPNTSSGGFGVSLGDLNTDGNLDAVIAVFSTATQVVCLGDGAGGLSCTNFTLNRAMERPQVALGYIDDDLFLDAVYANNEAGLDPGVISVLCRGDGAGAFNCSDLDAGIRTSAGVAVGDFGNVDLNTILEDGFEGGIE